MQSCWYFFCIITYNDNISSSNWVVWTVYRLWWLCSGPSYSLVWNDWYHLLQVSRLQSRLRTEAVEVWHRCFFRGPFVQIEPPVVPGGFARWGERRSPGEHDVGDTDVLVWKEGKPSVGGKAATGQLNPRGKCEEGLQTTMTAGNVTGSRFGLLVGKWCSTAGRTSWWLESSVMGEQASVDVADWKQQPASCTWQHILVMQTVVTHTYFNDFIWLLTHLFMSGQLID